MFSIPDAFEGGLKPINFGRDSGSPSDTILCLTVPDPKIAEVPSFDSVSEKKLAEGPI